MKKTTTIKALTASIAAVSAIIAIAGYCPYDIETPDAVNYEVCVSYGNPPPPCEIGVRIPGDDVCIMTYEDMGVRCIPAGSARANC